MQWGRRLTWLGLVGGGAYWLARYFRPQHSTLVLNDKVVIITGASSGIGRSLAFAFARRAARIVLVARNEERLEAVRREIEPYTSEALVIPTDVTDEDQLQALVNRTRDHFGRIDVLVNNAGFVLGGPLQDQDPARIEDLIRTNLWATIRLTQLVLPHMLAQHHGYIMNVGSVFGRTAAPLFAPFVAVKAGQAGFTDALRRELAGTGIRFTLVLPGWTYTDMLPQEVEAVGRRWFDVEHPDTVAERAILGLVHGEHEVVLGGRLAQLGVGLDRHAPLLMRLFWRFTTSPEWIAATRKIGQNDQV